MEKDEFLSEEYEKTKKANLAKINNNKAQDNKRRIEFWVSIIIFSLLLVIGILDLVLWQKGIVGVICPIISLAVTLYIEIFRKKNKKE